MNTVAVAQVSDDKARPVCNWGDPRLPDRFWDRVSPEPNSGCWLWIGEFCNLAPVYRVKGRKRVTARKFAYAAFASAVPDGNNVRNTCGINECCTPEHATIMTTAWRKTPARKASVSAYYKRNRDKLRWGRIRRTYGLEKADFERMLVEQGGGCALCREPFVSVSKAHIDHCHQTGSVRELLCYGCNVGMGSFYDRPDLLRAAADYIEKHRSAK